MTRPAPVHVRPIRHLFTRPSDRAVSTPWRTLALLVIVLVLALSGCEAPPAPATVQCGPGLVGVVWSSIAAPTGQIQFAQGGQSVGTSSVPEQGISAYATPVGTGTEQLLISAGNDSHDRTTVLRFDRSTCAASSRRLNAVAPLASAQVGDSVVTSSYVNNQLRLRRHALDGTLIEYLDLPGVIVGAVAPLGDHLIGFARLPDQTHAVIEFGVGPLRELRRLPVPDLDVDVSSFVVRGDTVYFPLTASESKDAPDRRLAALDLRTGSVRMVDLGADLPHLVSLQGDALYVAHTFMNPGFRPMAEMRHVSRVNLTTGNVEGFDLAVGISRWRVTSDRLLVVGEASDGVSHLVEYRLPDMVLLHDTALAPPPGRDTYYVAAIVLT